MVKGAGTGAGATELLLPIDKQVGIAPRLEKFGRREMLSFSTEWEIRSRLVRRGRACRRVCVL